MKVGLVRASMANKTEKRRVQALEVSVTEEIIRPAFTSLCLIEARLEHVAMLRENRGTAGAEESLLTSA